MTIEEILDEIIEQIGGDTDDTELQDKLLTCFKAGRRRIPAYINDRSFVGRDDLTLAVGEYRALLSQLDGFVKERAIWWEEADLSRVPIVLPPSLTYFNAIIRPQSTGKPLYYNIFAGTIEFDKGADEALTIGFDYFKAVSAIELTDDFVGDEQMIEISKDYCKMVYFRDYEQDPSQAAENERTAKEMMREKEGDWEEQTQGGHIEPTQQE